MPIINNIGLSNETLIKQEHFREIVRTHLMICNGIFKRNYDWSENGNYFYYDLNSGPGCYEGITGSPMIFLKEARIYRNIKFHCFLFEENVSNAAELEANIESMNLPDNFKINVIIKDSEIYLNKYMIYTKNCKFGMVYSDQNGRIPPFDTLSQFSYHKSNSRIDIVVNMSATNIKRVRGSSKCCENRNLNDYLRSIRKQAWLVRENHGKHQWTFLIGSNWKKFPEFKNIGFWNIQSREGNEIFSNLNSTAREKKSRGEYSCFQQMLPV